MAMGVKAPPQRDEPRRERYRGIEGHGVPQVPPDPGARIGCAYGGVHPHMRMWADRQSLTHVRALPFRPWAVGDPLRDTQPERSDFAAGPQAPVMSVDLLLNLSGKVFQIY